MKIKPFIALCALLFPVIPVQGADVSTKPSVVQTGQSSIQTYTVRGCLIAQSITTRFTPVTLNRGAEQNQLNLILRQSLQRNDQQCWEGVDGKITVTATSYDKNFKIGKPFWSFTSQGWEGTESPDGHETLYKVSMPGCCGSSDTDTYFSLWNGKRLFPSTGPLLTLSVPNSDLAERFVSLFDNGSAAFKDAVGASDAVAVLYFGTDKDAPESLVVHKGGDNAYHYSDLVFVQDGNEQSDRDLELWKADKSSDPKSLTGVTLRGKLECECECDTDDLLFIDIPVVNGHLDLKNAKSNDPAVTFTLGGARK